MRKSLLLGNLSLVALLVTGTGCFGHAEAGAYTEVDAPVVFEEEPTLVVVEPDVWVVRDYDYAVYYVDGYYWVYRDGWRRSRAYDRGWTTVEVNVVPRIIVSRDHRAYVHYHGPSNAPIRRAPRERDFGPNDHDRDDRRAAPPRRDNDNDNAPRPPQHAEPPRPPQHAEPPRPPQHEAPPRPPQHEAPPRPPQHEAPPRPPQHEAPRPPDRREVPPRHDARPDVNPREQRPKGNERRDDNRRDDRKDEHNR